MFQQSKSFNGLLAIILASLLWGTTGTAASFTPDVSPLATGAFAMGAGGVLLLLHAGAALKEEWRCLAARPKLLLAGGASVALYPLAFYTSMRISGVATGTVISIAAAPFFTALLERLINKKSVSLHWLLSFVAGATGIILLTMGRQDQLTVSTENGNEYTGVLLALIAAFSYAIYSWTGKQLIEEGISSRSSMAGMFGVAAIFLLPSLLYTGDNLFTGFRHISVAVYMAVIPMFLGYLLFGYGLRQIEASRATLITLLEPVVATLFAVTILEEAFSTVGWCGMALITLCLIMQSMGENDTIVINRQKRKEVTQ